MKILVVDDELVSRKKIEKLIQSFATKPLTAKDGIEAWQKWQHERTRMVITDWVMPDWMGWNSARRVRQVRRGQLYVRDHGNCQRSCGVTL
ncbi:MAG: response regulator [Deltaproteobacteria bacterium]|nr:response regulator [Deltaproteobacteria bacterium]